MTTRYTKRHYEDVAHIISRLQGRTLMEPREMRSPLAEQFAILFDADNPLFDRARFLAACGLDTEAWPNASGECSGPSTCIDHPESAD